MIVIWQLLDGSGIDDILTCLYKGATLRSIFNVHHFNKSLRSCKLLYTALSILLIEAYSTSNTSLPNSPCGIVVDEFSLLFQNLPNEYNNDSVKQKWFQQMIDAIDEQGLLAKLSSWAEDASARSKSFQFWYFILRHLLEPLITLYCSIRTSNFNSRNACVSKVGPLFFATNHRNYARLCAEHVFDLSSTTPYLLERLSKAFAVNRTHRPFSSKFFYRMVSTLRKKRFSLFQILHSIKVSSVQSINTERVTVVSQAD
jgi:hypothetical protein